MTTIYNYYVTIHFGGVEPKIGQLHKEIELDGGIDPVLQGISKTGDAVDCIFVSALSAGEQTTLDGLISAHVPNNSKPKNNFYTIYPKKSSIKTSTYTTSALFKYGGSDNIGTIDYIEIIAYKDSGVTSYDARIFDKKNNLVICEKIGLTNDSEEIQDLGTISNVPIDATIFELQVKKTGGNGNIMVYIDSVIIYHGN